LFDKISNGTINDMIYFRYRKFDKDIYEEINDEPRR